MNQNLKTEIVLQPTEERENPACHQQTPPNACIYDGMGFIWAWGVDSLDICEGNMLHALMQMCLLGGASKSQGEYMC